MKHIVKPPSNRRDTSAVMQELTRENKRGSHKLFDRFAKDVFETLDPLVQIHEKHEWWLCDILRKGDGFHLNGELR
jgi:hypothetical protein